MEHCPIEIIQQTLDELPDFECLKSTIQTSQRIWEAFKDRETWIVHQILGRDVSRALWFDAEAAMMASEISQSQDLGARKQFLENYLSRDIKSFYGVEYLSGEFVNNTLGSYLIHGDPLPKPLGTVPASDNEYIRIERCLYRFEIYCQIFCSAQFTPTKEEEALVPSYLSYFSTWEHEQFATIRDFMMKVLHSEQCQASQIEVIISLETANCMPVPDPVDHHISRGLKHILDILDGEDWTIPITPSEMISLPSPTLLYNHLRRVMPDDATLLGTLPEDSGPEEESTIIPIEWCPDADSGRADIWRLAYQMEPIMYCVDHPREKALRDWGYVFWDRERLEDMGVFKLQLDSHVQLWGLRWWTLKGGFISSEITSS